MIVMETNFEQVKRFDFLFSIRQMASMMREGTWYKHITLAADSVNRSI